MPIRHYKSMLRLGCGWRNNGKERSVRGTCDVQWVLAERDNITREAGKKETMRLCASFHMARYENSLYRVPLQSLNCTTREFRVIAVALYRIISEIAIKHAVVCAFEYQMPLLRLRRRSFCHGGWRQHTTPTV
ncbi:hypothetical protein EDC04DRAFT_2715387 [Pisolithus marmoratus]|nr:hypothetical protein EDC04DRAFT_2715387 [Pisolithus marmoratus]